jgi:hypothetical protein
MAECGSAVWPVASAARHCKTFSAAKASPNARFHDTLEYGAENVGFANRSLRARENAEWSGTLSSIERSQNHR